MKLDKDIIKGMRIGFGIFLTLGFLFGLVFAGTHLASQVILGTFIGNFIFQGNTTFNGSLNVLTGAIFAGNISNYTYVNNPNMGIAIEAGLIDPGIAGGIITPVSNGLNHRWLEFRGLNAGIPIENQLILSYNGNVGINTSTPSAKLEVVGAGLQETKGTGAVRVTGVATSSIIEMGVNYNYSGGASQNGWIQASNGAVMNLLINPNGGNVGIGTYTPQVSLEVAGRIRNTGMSSGSTGYYVCKDSNGELNYGASCSSSDMRLKKDIENISDKIDVISTLEKLRGVYFKWNNSNDFVKDKGNETQMGLIAQEVETVFPEVVINDNNSKYKALDYDKLVAFLIEVDKEQQHQIENKQSQIYMLLEENQIIKQELCNKDNSYSWCDNEIRRIGDLWE